MIRSYSTILLGLMIHTAVWAEAGTSWVDYGLMADGTMHSWSRDSVIQLDTWFFEVESRARFKKPTPIPGNNSYPPMSILYTRYRINCATGDHYPVSASYRDAGDQEIARLERPGAVTRTNLTGDKVRDRFRQSFCEGRFKSSRPGNFVLPEPVAR